MYSTNPFTPPVCAKFSSFPERWSTSWIFTPLLRKESSRSRLARMSKWYSMTPKVSVLARKCTSVPRLSGHLERRHRHAAAELHEMAFAFAANGQPEPVGERVDHRDAHAVQAAGDLVGVVVELASGVKLGHDDLCRRAFLLVLLVHTRGNAAAVVDYADRVVGVDGDGDLVAKARQGFVDGVVHNLEHHVMQSGPVRCVADVHPRPLADRIQAFQDLDAVGIVVLARVAALLRFSHLLSSLRSASALRRT